ISGGEFWDATIVTMLIGMVFTKIGCLLNGCCGGRPTESRLGLYLPNEHGVWCRRVPAQLLESGLAAILLMGALRAWDHLPFAGACFLGVVAGYGAGGGGGRIGRRDRQPVRPSPRAPGGLRGPRRLLYL